MATRSNLLQIALDFLPVFKLTNRERFFIVCTLIDNGFDATKCSKLKCNHERITCDYFLDNKVKNTSKHKEKLINGRNVYLKYRSQRQTLNNQ